MNTGTTLTPIPPNYVQAWVDTFPGSYTYSGTVASTGINEKKWGSVYDNLTIQQSNSCAFFASNIIINNGLKFQIKHDYNTKGHSSDGAYGWSGGQISTVTGYGSVDKGNTISYGSGFAATGGLLIIKGFTYPRVPGFNPVALLWPEDVPWPKTEMDLVEDNNVNSYPGQVWITTNHWADGTPSGASEYHTINDVDLTTGTHEIAFLWQPEQSTLKMYADGNLHITFTNEVAPKQFCYFGIGVYADAYSVTPVDSFNGQNAPYAGKCSSVEWFIDPNQYQTRGTGAYLDTGGTTTPVPAATVQVTLPSPFYVSSSTTFTGTISANVALALLWKATQPSTTDTGWVKATVSSSNTFSCPGVPVTPAGTAGTLWTMVSGTTVAAGFTATPSAAPVVPPVVKVTQPASLLTGAIPFSVTASGTYSLIELDWGGISTAPVASDVGWSAAGGTSLTATVNVTGAGTQGGLWYRVTSNGVLGAPALAFTMTPTAAPTVSVTMIPNQTVGQAVTVNGFYGGVAPPTLSYYLDAGAANAAPPPQVGVIGVTSIVTATAITLQVYKNTGGPQTIKWQLDQVVQGTLKDNAPDGAYDLSVPLPSTGTHNITLYMEAIASTATVPNYATTTFTVGSSTTNPANANIASGKFSFIISSGLPLGTHTITVVRGDNTAITAVSNSFIVAAATAPAKIYPYPSIQSSAVAPIARPGFNPNLNVLYNNDLSQNLWSSNRDWPNTIALGYAGKGGVPGWRNQPSWRRTLGSYGQPGVQDNSWNIAFRVVQSVQARPTSTAIVDIFTNPGSYMIAAGEPFVFWIPTVDDSQPTLATMFPFTGWSLPLRTVLMTVVDATSTTWTDGNGNAIKDSSGNPQTVHKYGIQLPAGTTVPAGFYWDNRAGVAAANLSTPILYGRHNSFYLNSATKQPRWQVKSLLDCAQYNVCQSGGTFIYSGDASAPKFFDYQAERNFFGDTVAYAFLGGEIEYVGMRLRAFPDPSLIAVETECRPTGPWTNVASGVDNGVRNLIVSFQIPRWRAALGPAITILVKGTNSGLPSWSLQNFDIVFPNDGPYGYAAVIYAGQDVRSTVYPDPTQPAGSNYNASGPQIAFNQDSDGQYVAAILSVLKARTGAFIAGVVELGVDLANTQSTVTSPASAATLANSNEPYRARMIGQFWSGLANAGHFAFIYGYGGDGNACIDLYNSDGLTFGTYSGNQAYGTLEMFEAVFRNEAVFANTAGSLIGLAATTALPAYIPTAVATFPIYTMFAQAGATLVSAGGSATTNIILGATPLYTGTVTLSVSGQPAGVTVTLSATSFSSISSALDTAATGANVCVATIRSTSTTALGSYPITVVSTDGTTTRTSTINLVVGTPYAAAAFKITPSAASVAVVQGTSASTTLTLSASSGYSKTVTLSAGALPAGVTASLSPASVSNGSGTVKVTLTAAASATVGPNAISILATDSSLTEIAVLTLAVSAPTVTPRYTLAPTAAAASVTQGSSAKLTFNLTPVGAYAGTDSFSVGSLPAGVSVALSAPAIINGSGSVVATFSAAASAASTAAMPNNWAWAAGHKFGMNIERYNCAIPSFAQEAINSCVAASNTHIRGFINWTPDGSQGYGPAACTPAQINPFLDTARAAINAGLDFHLDCMDLLPEANCGTNGNIDQIVIDQVTAVCNAVKAYNFDPTRFAIGPVNEWETGSGSIQIPAQKTLLRVMLNILGPSQPLVFTSCYYDTAAAANGSDFLTNPGALSGITGLVNPIYQSHCYIDAANSSSAWDAEAAYVTVVQKNFGCPAIMGEMGCAGNGDPDYGDAKYEAAIQAMVASKISQYSPCLWALTNGTAKRMNVSATDGTLVPAMVTALQAANKAIPGIVWPGAATIAAPIVIPINVTDGTLALSSQVTLSVVPSATAPTYALTPTTASIGVAQGGSTTTTLILSPSGSYTSSVTLSVGSLPAGIAASLSQTTVSGGSGSVTLTIGASATATIGTDTLTITATDGSTIRTTIITASVSAPLVAPSFTLMPATAVVSVLQGASVATTLSLASIGNYTGTDNLSVGTLPAGISASLSPLSITNGTGSFVATFTAASGAAIGTDSITITATDGTLTRTATISLNVSAVPIAPSFAVSPTAAAVSVIQGAAATATLAVTSTGGYTGTNAVSFGTLPAGVTGSLSTSSISNGSGLVTVTLAATSAAAVGTDAISVSISDGTLTRTSTISLTVAAPAVPATFTLMPTSAAASVVQGSHTSTSLTLAAVGSYTGTDAVSFGALPAGVTATLSTASITNGSGTVTATFSATSAATVGTDTVTILATDGVTSRTSTVSLTVTAPPIPPNFSLMPATASVSVNQGASTGTTLTLAPVGGYLGTDSISAGGLPAGVSVSFSTTSISNGAGTVTATFSATSAAAIGTDTIVITAGDGTLSHSSTISLAVAAPPPSPTFTMTPSLASVAIVQGATASHALTLTSSGNYTGSDALSIGTLPAGVTASLSAPSISNGSGTFTISFTASSAAAVATSVIAITATDGAITRTSTIDLVVSAPPVPASYAVTPTSASLAVLQGYSASQTLIYAATGGYTGVDAVSVGTLPAGITAILSSNSLTNGTGTITLTLSASTSAAVGTSTIIVTATDGTLATSSAITLAVSAPPPAPNFAVSPTSASVSVLQGATATQTFAFASTGGYVGTDAVSLSALPAGVTASLSAASITNGTGSVIVSLVVSTSAAVGSTPIVLTATDGTLVRSSTITLAVTAPPPPPPSFSLTPGTASLTVVQGASTTQTLTLAATGAYTGTDALSVGSLPAGITASFSAASVTNGAGSVVLTLAASAPAAVTTSSIVVTATDGTITRTSTLNLAVNAPPIPPSFALTPVTASVAVLQGAGATVKLTATPSGAYLGTDTVNIGSLPNGVTVTPSPSTISNGSGTITLAFAASGTATIGSFDIPVSLTDSTNNPTSTVTLVISAPPVPPSFAVTPTTASVSVAQGSAVIQTLTLSPTGGYSGMDSFAIGTLPTGVSAALSSPTLSNGTGSVRLTLAAAIDAPLGTSTIPVTITDGTITETVNISLSVISPAPVPGFGLTPSAATVNIVQGNLGTTTLTLTADSGYTGTDNFNIGACPVGVSAELSASSIINAAGSVTLTFAASSAAATGSSTVLVGVTDGTLTKTATITLVVSAPPVPPSYALTPTHAAISVQQGANSPLTLSLSATGGYSGTNTFSVSALPAGVSASISDQTVPNGSGATTIIFGASPSASTGSFAATVSVTDGSISQTCTVALTITAAPSASVSTLTVNAQNPIYTGSGGSFSGSGADPTQTLAVALVATGIPSASDPRFISALVSSNGSWSVTGITIANAGSSATLWALIGGTQTLALESIVPVDPPAPSKTPPTPLLVGPTVVGMDGSGTFTISCGAISGGTVPYSFQFQRVTYTGGTPGSVQNVGPNGPNTTVQDSSLPLNTTAGYFVTVTDSGSPAQSVTTRPNVVTYGMPAPAGGSTPGPTLAQIYALLQSQNSIVQTIATNTGGPATPRF